MVTEEPRETIRALCERRRAFSSTKSTDWTADTDRLAGAGVVLASSTVDTDRHHYLGCRGIAWGSRGRIDIYSVLTLAASDADGGAIVGSESECTVFTHRGVRGVGELTS